jgi:hypothetical protein
MRCDGGCGKYIPFALAVEGFPGNFCSRQAVELAEGDNDKIFYVVSNPKQEIKPWAGHPRTVCIDRGRLGAWRVYIPRGIHLKQDPGGRVKIPVTIPIEPGSRRRLADIVLRDKL